MQDMQSIIILLGEQLAMLEQKLVKRRQTPQVDEGNSQRETDNSKGVKQPKIQTPPTPWCISWSDVWLPEITDYTDSLGMDQKWRWKQSTTKLCSWICFDKEASDRSHNTQAYGRDSQGTTSVMLLAVVNGTRLRNSACVRGLDWIIRRH